MPTPTRTIAATAAVSVAATAGLFAAAGFTNAPAPTAAAEVAAAATTAAVAQTVPSAAAGTYKIDAVHSSVLFKIRHFDTANFYGRFNQIDGQFEFDPSNPAATNLEFTVPIASLDTANDARDNHLKGGDFFNARQFPTATFKSTNPISVGSNNTLRVIGDLTIAGVTRQVSFPVAYTGNGTNNRGAEIAGFETSFEIKRADYGITTWVPEDGGDDGGLGNTVELIIALEVIKQ